MRIKYLLCCLTVYGLPKDHTYINYLLHRPIRINLVEEGLRILRQVQGRGLQGQHTQRRLLVNLKEGQKTWQVELVRYRMVSVISKNKIKI